VIPKKIHTAEYGDHLRSLQDQHDAAYEYDAGKRDLLDRTLRRFGMPTTGRGDGEYHLGGLRSFFQDLAWSSQAAEMLGSVPPPTVGSVAQARARVDQVEKRDLTTSATDGGGFLGNGAVPGYIAAEFALAMRTHAQIASVLKHADLPASGMVVTSPRLSTGTSTAVQATENTAVSETDIVESLVSSPVGTVAGTQSVSQQLFDRAEVGSTMDLVIARDLAASLAASLEAQIVSGSGTAPQLRGLANTVGITAVTKSGAGTAVTNIKAIGDTVRQAEEAFGGEVDTLILAPRRAAWIVTTLGYAPAPWPVPNLVISSALRSDLGASTNEDEVFVLPSQETILHTAPPTFRAVLGVTGSGTLSMRFVASMYCALLAGRMPAAIGHSTGAEWAAPSW